MKKILIITWIIFSCIVSAEVFAQNTAQDPDLKLSTEELKKKYPISLLDGKKKDYKEGQKINLDDYSAAEIKAAFLNADKNFVSKRKTEYRNVKTKNSESLVNYEVTVKNRQEVIIIEESCNKITGLNWEKLDKKWEDIMLSIFDNPKVYELIPFLPPKASVCTSDLINIRGI